MHPAVTVIRSGEPAALRVLLDQEPSLVKKPQLVIDAARFAVLPALELLLVRGADPNALARGYRPLHALIQERSHGETVPTKARLACLDRLLANGADPEALGAWPPARAILIAAFGGEWVFVESLRSAGARVDGFVACALGEEEGVRRALEEQRGFAHARDEGGLTGLQCAAASRLGKGDERLQRALLAIAARLLDKGADPNARTRSWTHDVDAAYFACSAGDERMLALLLARGADPTAALPSAAWSSTDLAALVLQKGAKPDRAVHEGKPLLNQLVRWGQVQPALWLLEHGASPNVADERGWTAVHQAASRGNARMLVALLAAGGDPRRKDAQGQTPVDVARAMGREKMTALLSGARTPARGRKSKGGRKAKGTRKPQRARKTTGVRKPQRTPKATGVRKPQRTPKATGARKPQRARKAKGARKPRRARKAKSARKTKVARRSQARRKPAGRKKAQRRKAR